MHQKSEATLCAAIALGVTTAGACLFNPPVWADVCPPDRENHNLMASDGETGDAFGISAAIDGPIAIIGAYREDELGDKSGSAYLFDAVTGQELLKLNASDGNELDDFGYSVSIAGGRAVVGSYGHDRSRGAAYVFDVTTGEELFKLTAFDGVEGDLFGWSVSMDEERIIVGAPRDDDFGFDSGAAYIYDAVTGEGIRKLTPSDGAFQDFFGRSVAIDGDRAIVGAYWDDDHGNASGSAYVFDVFTGEELFKLTASDGSAGDCFGWSVALDDGRAIVGAYWDDDGGLFTGSAYVFDVATGDELFKLRAFDAEPWSEFGISVAIDGQYAVVGAHREDGRRTSSGSAYVFNVNTGEELFKLEASYQRWAANFGRSVAIDDGWVISGARGERGNKRDSGTAYVFELECECMALSVRNLVAGRNALINVSGGSPGAKAATVYGLQSGESILDDVAGYCATLGIDGVNRGRVLGGLKRTFDANGVITFRVPVPANAQGRTVYFQSAQQGTCPDECVSNVVVAMVQ